MKWWVLGLSAVQRRAWAAVFASVATILLVVVNRLDLTGAFKIADFLSGVFIGMSILLMLSTRETRDEDAPSSDA
ncbi:MAG: hypothetical protein V2A56_01580 [bacterium]